MTLRTYVHRGWMDGRPRGKEEERGNRLFLRGCGRDQVFVRRICSIRDEWNGRCLPSLFAIARQAFSRNAPSFGGGKYFCFFRARVLEGGREGYFSRMTPTHPHVVFLLPPSSSACGDSLITPPQPPSNDAPMKKVSRGAKLSLKVFF